MPRLPFGETSEYILPTDVAQEQYLDDLKEYLREAVARGLYLRSVADWMYQQEKNIIYNSVDKEGNSIAPKNVPIEKYNLFKEVQAWRKGIVTTTEKAQETYENALEKQQQAEYENKAWIEQQQGLALAEQKFAPQVKTQAQLRKESQLKDIETESIRELAYNQQRTRQEQAQRGTVALPSISNTINELTAGIESPNYKNWLKSQIPAVMDEFEAKFPGAREAWNAARQIPQSASGGVQGMGYIPSAEQRAITGISQQVYGGTLSESEQPQPTQDPLSQYLKSYPWYREYLNIPARQRGYFPTNYRPSARWV